MYYVQMEGKEAERDHITDVKCGNGYPDSFMRHGMHSKDRNCEAKVMREQGEH